MASPSSDHDPARLSRRVRELTTLLRHTIARLEGDSAYTAVEDCRRLAKAAREGRSEATDQLARRVGGLSLGESDRLAMALSLIHISEPTRPY